VTETTATPDVCVNDSRIPAADIEREAQRLQQPRDPQTPPPGPDEARRQARQNLIDRALLLETARATVPAVTAEDIDAELKRIYEQHGSREQFYERMGMEPAQEDELRHDLDEQLTVRRLYEQWFANADPIADDACRAFYDSHPEHFQEPEQVHACHIVRRPDPGEPPAQLTAQLLNLRQRILAGADFGELAEQHSECDGNGDLGFFARGQMVPAFDDVVFALQPGDVSDVFRTEFGFHLVKVLERREGAMRDFEACTDAIRQFLERRRRDERVTLELERLRAAATIEDVPPVHSGPTAEA
jgi:parvulin-like peptidyl-prolyl isomerase